MQLILAVLSLALAAMLSLPPGIAAKARMESSPQVCNPSSPGSCKKSQPSRKVTKKRGKG